MEEITQKEIQIIKQNSCLGWTVLSDIKRENGKKLEFKNHSFLIDIYNDWTPIQTCRKASQIGFSTMQIIKSLWAMKYKGWNVIYTLPSFSDIQQFVPSKVNAIISQNPILREWTKDKDTILQKKIGNNFIYYRGTLSGKSQENQIESGVGIMFTADLLLADESDRSDQKALEQYESRLDASDYKGKWHFSNPSHPNTLSQKLWDKSDQKHWFVKCPHCGEWQYLEWPNSIKDRKYICKKCGREITDDARRDGEWIKRYKDKDVSGYWISQLISHPAKEIEEKAQNKSKDYFYNFVLGLPYRGSDVVVDKNLILKCIDYSMPNLLQNNVLGVDVGLTKHYVLMNRQGIFKVGVVENWEDIELLIRKYDVRIAVIDALPDLTEPRKLQQKYLGIIWLSYFKKEIQKAEYVKWDGASHTVYSDRGKMLGLLIDEFADNKTRFQMKPEELELYIKHWSNVYKVKKEDSLGIEHEIWDTSGENHLVMATLYARLALDKIGDGGTKLIEYSGEKLPTAPTNKAPSIDKILQHQNKSPDDWKI